MAIKRSHVWPLPVYVATFADGTVCRLSIGSYKKGVTYDFARGRKICCDVIGNERGRQAREVAFAAEGERHGAGFGTYHPDDIKRWMAAYGYDKPATDLASGHFEHDGTIVPDPFFDPTPARKAPARKSSTIDTLIASLNKLTAAELLRLADELEVAFDAAE